jgi:hypothetical protein
VATVFSVTKLSLAAFFTGTRGLCCQTLGRLPLGFGSTLFRFAACLLGRQTLGLRAALALDPLFFGDAAFLGKTALFRKAAFLCCALFLGLALFFGETGFLDAAAFILGALLGEALLLRPTLGGEARFFGQTPLLRGNPGGVRLPLLFRDSRGLTRRLFRGLYPGALDFLRHPALLGLGPGARQHVGFLGLAPLGSDPPTLRFRALPGFRLALELFLAGLRRLLGEPLGQSMTRHVPG